MECLDERLARAVDRVPGRMCFWSMDLAVIVLAPAVLAKIVLAARLMTQRVNGFLTDLAEGRLWEISSYPSFWVAVW